MIEWFFENLIVIGVVLSIISISILIYKYDAIKYNLPLPKWIKYGSFGDGAGPPGGL